MRQTLKKSVQTDVNKFLLNFITQIYKYPSQNLLLYNYTIKSLQISASQWIKIETALIDRFPFIKSYKTKTYSEKQFRDVILANWLPPYPQKVQNDIEIAITELLNSKTDEIKKLKTENQFKNFVSKTLKYIKDKFLQVFHKLFERQLNSKITHHHRQYVGRKSGLLSAKLQVAHMLNNNQNHFAPQNDDTQTDATHNSAQDDTIWDVVKVDIQNAFNELPHDQIRQALENSAISLQDRRYIFNHLQSRWADDIPRVRQGVSTGDVISQKLFLACVDPILFELDEKGYRAVMYADDLTVLHKRGEFHQTVELLANMFQKIGLVINKDKCEGTDPSSGNTTGVIEFLGQNIGINSEPIAVQIQKQLQTRIKALQKYDIPKFYQYLIFKQCIIPSANYGPFLEASITETQLADAKDKYDYIDIMLAEAMEEILESDLATKDLLDVMILSKDDGGLDLITPGAYFDLMIQNRDMAFQDPTKVNKETRDFFSKNRHEFINSKQYPTNVKSEVKLGHCLDNYQITNKGFQYLVDMRFNKKQKYVSLDTKCDLCNCKNDIYHELNCKKLQRNHILTHDYFVRQLADKMIDANKVREVKEVSKNNNNRTDQKHKADISFIKDGKQQFFDIGISWDTERYFAVKQKHYQTETVNGQPITCTQLLSEKIRRSIQNHQPHFDKQVSKIHGYTSKLESQCPTTENKQTIFSGKRLEKHKINQQNQTYRKLIKQRNLAVFQSMRQQTQTLEHKILAQNLKRNLGKNLKCSIAKRSKPR
ncbi:Reverse_transcriptase (RNA-dependent DNA polymerase) [Hexamita inflata]|uniref:Reverse transcriptase (RNA-dependent DNA polymerase) n=1 Tax=Hexamita inflata TaxID=28002 RepID=A0AA86QNQ6_9EUKA|nr:Reverse transcriptase (RNA-dependent DNA polymerase) [Hexamita inflata]